MKTNLLKKINLLLGTISVALAGCHIQKQPVEPTPTPPQEADKPIVEQTSETEPLLCMYGAPPEVYERPMRKYGPPDSADRE